MQQRNRYFLHEKYATPTQAYVFRPHVKRAAIGRRDHLRSTILRKRRSVGFESHRNSTRAAQSELRLARHYVSTFNTLASRIMSNRSFRHRLPRSTE